MSEGFNPPGLSIPFGAFSRAAWAPPGRTLYLSGQVANDADGTLIGDGDVRAQTRQVIRNIGTILESVGGTLDDVVSVIVYVLDMEHLGTVHEVRREFFTQPYPASTLVQVVGLVDPRYLIEISAVAVIPSPAPA